MSTPWILLPWLLPLYQWRWVWLGVPTNALELGVVLLVLGWLFTVRGAWRLLVPARVLWWPLGVLAVATVLGVLTAADTVSALGYAKAYVVLPGFLFFVVQAQRWDERTWRQLLLSFGFLAAVLVAIGGWQVATGHGLPIPWDYDRRATGVFPYPNALGLLLAPLATMFFVSAWRWRAVGFAFFGVVALVGCALAETEAALVAVPAALGVTAVIVQPTWGRRAGVVALGVVLVCAALMVGPVREKLLLHDYSGGVRRSQWGETVELLRDHPLLGVGLGGYPAALAPYHQAVQYEIFQYPHNVMLNQWVELGALGVAALFWMIVVSSARWVQDRSFLPLVTGAALVTMLIHGLVDVPFFKNDLAVLTALLFGIFWQNEKSPAGPVRLTDRR